MCSQNAAHTSTCRRLTLLSLSVLLLAEYRHIASARSISLLGTQELKTSLTKHSRRDCSCSPYSLGFASFSKSSFGDGQGDSRYCFLVSFRGCDSGDTCCETLLRGGVDSLYLQTSGGTLRPLRHKHVEMEVRQVEVNGSVWAYWDAAPQRIGGFFPAGMGGTDAATLRIFALSADSSTFSGTTICLTTTSVVEPGPQIGEQLLCESAEACRFAVTPASTGSDRGVRKDAAVCPVLGFDRRTKLLAEMSAVNTSRASPPPAKRPVSSPPFRPPSPRRMPSPPIRKPPPSLRQASSPPPPPSPPPPSQPLSSSLDSKTSDAATISYSPVCGAINLISPRDESGTLTYTFGKQISCDGAAEWMVKNLTDAARQAGAHISIPFALESCSSTYDPNVKPPVVPYVMVCGSFTNVKEAAKTKGLLNPILVQWSYLLLGRKLPDGTGTVPYMCPPPGYVIKTMVWGIDGESPFAFSQVQCSMRP